MNTLYSILKETYQVVHPMCDEKVWIVEEHLRTSEIDPTDLHEMKCELNFLELWGEYNLKYYLEQYINGEL